MLNTKDKFRKEVVPVMRKKFGYGNDMAVPVISKVVVNVGIGKIYKEAEKMNEIMEALTTITGQKPIKTQAKKAIAGFKIRENQEVGIKVTLRGKRMWQFIDRLINAAFPRTRDFQGINKAKAVDTSGNLNVGIKEHVIFPEIQQEKVKHIFSFQVNVTTTAQNKEEGTELLTLLGFPLKDAH